MNSFQFVRALKKLDDNDNGHDDNDIQFNDFISLIDIPKPAINSFRPTSFASKTLMHARPVATFKF